MAEYGTGDNSLLMGEAIDELVHILLGIEA